MLHAQGLLGDGGDCQYGAQPQCEMYRESGGPAPHSGSTENCLFICNLVYTQVFSCGEITQFTILKCSVCCMNTLFPLTKANIKPIQYQ